MTLTFFAVKDELSNRFLAPILMNSEAEAKRQFKTQINNIPMWKDNPADFSLWRIGEFDEETGNLIYDQEKLVNGRSVVDED